MLRTTCKANAAATRRRVEQLGRSAPHEPLAIVLEATVVGRPSASALAGLLRAAGVLDGADLTGWFDEPFLPELARWLDSQIRPHCESAGERLAGVTAAVADTRCEYHP